MKKALMNKFKSIDIDDGLMINSYVMMDDKEASICANISIQSTIQFIENMVQIDYSIRKVYIDELKKQL